MRVLIGMIMVGLLAWPAWSSDVVDPSVTYGRLQQLLAVPHPRSWQNQMVLWQGTVLNQVSDDRYITLWVQVGSQGVVEVRYRRTCPTLQDDRRSYRVAVKGQIVLGPQGFDRLEGRSLILLEPPARDGFVAFERRLPQPRRTLAELIAWRFAFHRPAYPDSQALTWGAKIVADSAQEHVDPLLLAALMQIESAYDVNAVSPSGAIGLGQLMSFTASGLGLDAHRPSDNIMGSARYLGGLLVRFASWPDPVRYSLAAYNAGPEAVERHHGIPPVPETRNYVIFVRLVWKELQSERDRYRVLSAGSGSGP